MNWRTRVVCLLAIGLVLPMLVFAAGSEQTHSPVPTSGSSFYSALQTFLKREDAQRFAEMFVPFVWSGGTHGTGAGLTKTPTALTAYPGGYYVTETGSITYNDNDTCYVIAHKDLTGNAGTYTRVSGTHYLIDCASASEPALPANSVRLMTVTTAGGAVTVVTDRRVLTPLAQMGFNSAHAIGDLFYANTTTTIARLPDVADGNVLRSGGVGVAPAYGKVRLSGATTDFSGILVNTGGGTGQDSSAWSGVPSVNSGTWQQNTITQNRLFIGGASNAISMLAAGTNKQILQGSTGNAPAWTLTIDGLTAVGATSVTTTAVISATPATVIASSGFIRLGGSNTVVTGSSASGGDCSLHSLQSGLTPHNRGCTNSLADTATLDIGFSSFGAVRLLVSIVEDNDICEFVLRGTANATREIYDPATICSAAAGTATSINVFWNGGTLSYRIQNLRGGTRTLQLLATGA